MYVIKDELDHFAEKFAKFYTYRFSCQEDQIRIPVQLFQIRTGQKVLDQDPQHCWKELYSKFIP
jgi:hypothetical protein